MIRQLPKGPFAARPLRAAAALAALLLVSGCGGGAVAAQGTPEAGDQRIHVVASTSVYADVARAIGGDHVDAKSIINKLSQDPHSYEATVRDKLAVSKADLLIANGGGYDVFIEVLAGSLKLDPQTVISVVDLAAEGHGEHPAEAEAEPEADHGHGHDHGAGNEHVWYDPHAVAQLTLTLTERFTAAKPEAAGEFSANAKAFIDGTDKLSERLERLAARGDAKSFAMTEPVPYYLLTEAGMNDATPEGLGEAMESGGDIPPLLLKRLSDGVRSGSYGLLAYNSQTSGPQTDAVREIARAAGVPALDFTETLPVGESYLTWMNDNVAQLEAVREH